MAVPQGDIANVLNSYITKLDAWGVHQSREFRFWAQATGAAMAKWKGT
jgi:hypothetical protein